MGVTLIPMGREEFVDRFVERMLRKAGPILNDNSVLEQYARDVGPAYYQLKDLRMQGPEACADADMSYWGKLK